MEETQTYTAPGKLGTWKLATPPPARWGRARKERTMNHAEVIPQLQFEYYGALEAAQRDDEANGTNYAAHFVSFYDYLLRRGYTRQRLSALGVSRENALRWRAS